jgi:hypothetical protein
LDVHGSNSSSRNEDLEPSEDRPPANRPPRIAPNRRPPGANGTERGGGDRPSVPPIRPRR